MLYSAIIQSLILNKTEWLYTDTMIYPVNPFNRYL